jgi:hypothetical protein
MQMNAARSSSAFVRWGLPFCIAAILFSVPVLYFGSIRNAVYALKGRSVVVDFPGHLGLHNRGSSIAAKISVKNVSNRAVEVLGGRFGCTCITTSSLPLTIPPWGKAIIDLQINVRGDGRQQFAACLFVGEAKREEVGVLSYDVGS